MRAADWPDALLTWRARALHPGACPAANQRAGPGESCEDGLAVTRWTNGKKEEDEDESTRDEHTGAAVQSDQRDWETARAAEADSL